MQRMPILAHLFKEKSTEGGEEHLAKKYESLFITMPDEEKLAAEFTATLVLLESASEK